MHERASVGCCCSAVNCTLVMVGKAAADARGEAAMANLPAYANCCRC